MIALYSNKGRRSAAWGNILRAGNLIKVAAGKKVLYLLFVILTISIFSTCTIKQEVELEKDGSGRVDFRIEIERFFLDYHLDMAELTGELELSEQSTIFDIEKIRAGLNQKPGVTVTRLVSPITEVVEGSFTFRNIEEVFNNEALLTKAEVMGFTRVDNVKSLKLHLDRGNFEHIYSLFPILASPVVESFGPLENEDTSEKEYLEIIEFALGEEGPEGIMNSFINLDIKVDGRLLSQSGGTMNKEGVSFQIPLIRVLLLDQPLDYSITKINPAL
ncbi:hypothetical protein ES708_12139 [subsurface metagenome]